MIKKLGINNTFDSSTRRHFKKVEIVDNYRYVPLEFQPDLPSLSCISKLHICPLETALLLGLPNAPRNIYPNY